MNVTKDVHEKNDVAASKFRIRSIVFLLVILIIIAVFVQYIYSARNRYIDLLQISSKDVFYLLLIALFSLFINGLIATLLFRSLGATLSFWEGFFLAAASTFANQLPISGGLITRGVYLKRKHHISYTKFFSASLALFVCFVSANGFIGFIILLYWLFFKNISVSPFLLIGFAVMFASLLIFLLPINSIRFPEKIRIWILQAMEGWDAISKSPTLVAELIGLQTSLMLMLAARYWVAFHMLSQKVSAGEVILFSSASVLTQLVSIAPGGLGITEIIVGGIASILGFAMSISVLAVGIDRLTSTLVILLVGGGSTIVLGRKISESSKSIDSQNVISAKSE